MNSIGHRVFTAFGTINNNKWYFITGSYNGLTMTSYINGVNVGTYGQNGTITQQAVGRIGYSGGGSEYFYGMIADIQIYNASLDANSVTALYQEGIGGVPVNLQSLVAWYPLNGNSNDYSGNLYNAVPAAGANIVYSNQWMQGYTVP